ncbi:MAG: NERD domain-containing protein [Gemmatimonadetes bacterium]|nr:NERD domain-containing protein [Gemmatimonadota bacterium]
MLYDLAILPLKEFFGALNAGERSVLFILLAVAAAMGFVLGRRQSPGARGYRTLGAWRFPSFQNSGEELVARVLLAHFHAPDYHLMNHVTLRMADGTTQVDHVLVSRFGVFVIETKDYSGWIFANESGAKWTRVHYRLKHRFQNPIRQNFRHLLAVQNLLEFVPRDAIKSVVVFCGSAEFKTEVPDGVVHVDELVTYLKEHTVELMALNRMQYAVGRLETARLALSGKTDVAHVESLRRRLGGGAD